MDFLYRCQHIDTTTLELNYLLNQNFNALESLSKVVEGKECSKLRLGTQDRRCFEYAEKGAQTCPQPRLLCVQENDDVAII